MLAGRASRPKVPFWIPPKLITLKCLVMYSVIYVVQWNYHPSKVIGISLPSPMTTANTPVLVSASTRMIPWCYSKPGWLKQREKLEIFCSDGGREYMLLAFSKYLTSCVVKCEVTNAYTPQENR